VGTLALVLTTYRFLKDGIIHFLDMVRKGGRGLGYGISPGILVLPPISLLQGLFFGQREVLLGYRFVVRKGREFGREEFTVSVYPSSGIDVGHVVHVLDDTRNQGLILFLGVLLVQDAVLLVPETDAGEAVCTTMRGITVMDITPCPNKYVEVEAGTIGAGINRLIDELAIRSNAITIVTLIHFYSPINAILTIAHVIQKIEAVLTIVYMKQVVTGGILGVVDIRKTPYRL
jgi:hypothetical protein